MTTDQPIQSNKERVYIFDTTLRDGEQSPGATMTLEEKLQVAEALRMIHEEGLERVFQRHDEMAALARRRAGSLGLSLQSLALSTSV